MKEERRCSSCKFYVIGRTCHRYPPQVVSDTFSRWDDEDHEFRVYSETVTLFPTVEFDDWCNEWVSEFQKAAESTPEIKTEGREAYNLGAKDTLFWVKELFRNQDCEGSSLRYLMENIEEALQAYMPKQEKEE